MVPRDSGFVDFVLERMAGLGDVRAKSMFGGHGIYQGDLIFAIVADGGLYFKADASTREEYVARGLQPFTYEARGKNIPLQYYAAPPDVFDEEEAMIHWAKQAIGVALRARNEKKSSPKKPRTRRR